jgi:hypothetical protein
VTAAFDTFETNAGFAGDFEIPLPATGSCTSSEMGDSRATWSFIGSILKSQGFEPLPPPGPLAHRRPTFLIGRIGPCSGGASNGANGRGWTVGGVRIDDVGAWDLRPIFADPY